jgi:hypothetical protein
LHAQPRTKVALTVKKKLLPDFVEPEYANGETQTQFPDNDACDKAHEKKQRENQDALSMYVSMWLGLSNNVSHKKARGRYGQHQS